MKEERPLKKRMLTLPNTIHGQKRTRERPAVQEKGKKMVRKRNSSRGGKSARLGGRL